MDNNPKAPADTSQAGNSSSPPRPTLLDKLPGWLRLPLLALIGLFIVGPIEVIRKSMRTTYGPSVYSLRGYFGMLLSALAGAGVGYYDGWLQGHIFPGWVLKGVGTAMVSFYAVIPLLYDWVIHNLQRLSDVIWEGAERRHDHAITRLLTNLTYVLIPAAVLVFAWAGRADSYSLLTHVFWGVVLGATAFHYLQEHPLRTISVVFGAVAAYAYASRTKALVVALGYPGNYACPAYIAEMVAFSGFVFPFFHVVFTGGWLQKINEETYGKPDSQWKQEYLEFAVTAFSLLVAIYWTKNLAQDLLPLMSLPHWASIPGAAALATYWTSLLLFSVGTVLTFCVLFITLADILTTSTLTTNWVVGGALALLSGGKSASYYLSHGFAYGKLGALAVFLGSAAAVYWLLYPAFFWVTRPIFNFLLVQLLPVQTVLNRLVSACTTFTKEFFNTVVESWEQTYSDESPFKDFFAHGLTLTATAAVYFTTLDLSLQREWETWRTVLAVAPPTIITLLLLGAHLLERSTYMFGALLSTVAGVLAATFSFAIYPGWQVVLITFATITATALVFFPLPYAFACKIVNRLHPEIWVQVIGLPYNACDYIFSTVKQVTKQVYIAARDNIWNPLVELVYQVRDEVYKLWEQFSSKR